MMMKQTNARDTQLSHIIAEEVAFLLSTAGDPRLSQLIVTQVETKKGGRAYTIYLSPPLESASQFSRSETQASLEKAGGYLRGEVHSMLNLKRSPSLIFRLQ